ncbi:hypothetical protein TSA1_22380 [Bradyrhizobium nitroreducens]|uniref:Uncharacterized protein n=1 Tax=Bradyrhizobium nitroreducens TaxID=709803 RepID=A0A2M6UF11_9BRAD|nr:MULTISPECIES: hypothetical protein [Bradyrhizobium]PIT03196.1 hypothetical protein TSA1_22380 [Bradyrhizobium nitroreducens]TQF43550.1 hypothetical protein UNPF46_02855 [Bradyrhizobium sp. UNPF46]
MAMLGEGMQAKADGLAFAVANGPVAPTGGADTSYDLEVGPCTSPLRLLVAVGFAMTLFSATLAFDWWGGLGDYDTMAGFAGVVVFSLTTIRLIWMLPTERGAVVVVTPYGIRDLRIGNEFLPWDSIAEISAEQRRGHMTIVLTPTPALLRQLRSIRNLARRAESDRILIRSEGLAADFDTVLRACRDAHAASTPRTALQQEDERGTQGFAVQAS